MCKREALSPVISLIAQFFYHEETRSFLTTDFHGLHGLKSASEVYSIKPFLEASFCEGLILIRRAIASPTANPPTAGKNL